MEFGAVIFTTGYRRSYDWIEFPITDQLGYPITSDGASPAVPGLYFCGVHVMRSGDPGSCSASATTQQSWPTISFPPIGSRRPIRTRDSRLRRVAESGFPRRRPLRSRCRCLLIRP